MRHSRGETASMSPNVCPVIERELPAWLKHTLLYARVDKTDEMDEMDETDDQLLPGVPFFHESDRCDRQPHDSP